MVLLCCVSGAGVARTPASVILSTVRAVLVGKARAHMCVHLCIFAGDVHFCQQLTRTRYVAWRGQHFPCHPTQVARTVVSTVRARHPTEHVRYPVHSACSRGRRTEFARVVPLNHAVRARQPAEQTRNGALDNMYEHQASQPSLNPCRNSWRPYACLC